MGVEVEAPCLDERALAYNFTNEGGVFGTWRLSKNIMGLWLIQECRREWGISYDEITRLAAEARPFLAVIDPDAEPFFHPGSMSEKIRQFCARSGQPVPQTRGEIARVALESLALKYRLVLERLEELTGTRLTPLHIIGGGTKNRLLNQFTADAVERPVMAGPGGSHRHRQSPDAGDSARPPGRPASRPRSRPPLVPGRNLPARAIPWLGRSPPETAHHSPTLEG